MEIGHGVTVKILFFAQAKDLAGTRESTLYLPHKISYRQLLDIIVEKYNLKKIKKNILLARNEEVCEDTINIDLSERDNIAVIPPLSGG